MMEHDLAISRRAEFSLAYAYPTSANAEKLGYWTTGCWYVEGGMWGNEVVSAGYTTEESLLMDYEFTPVESWAFTGNMGRPLARRVS